MKDKEKDKGAFDNLLNFGGDVYKRAVAAKAYYDGTIDKLRRELVDRGQPPWRVLQYQRVIDPEVFPLPVPRHTFVRPKTLESHFEYLRDSCNVVALKKLLALIDQHEEIPDKTVAITFDGGHMDNFLTAFPLLTKFGLPATFFVSVGYIESGLFHVEDRITYGLLAYADLKYPFPNLAFLDDEFREKLSRASKGKEVSLSTIPLFLAALRRTNVANRFLALETIGERLANQVGLPDMEDFMRWEDIRVMIEHRHSFGLMGYAHLLASDLSEQDFIEDLSRAYEKAKEEGIEMEPIFSFLEGVTADPALNALQKLALRFAMAIGPTPQPKYQVKLPMLIGRIPMCEVNSYSKDVFACRLWQLQIAKIKF